MFEAIGVILLIVYLQIRSELDLVSPIINSTFHLGICCALTLGCIISFFFIGYQPGNPYLRSIPFVIFVLSLLVYRYWVKQQLGHLVKARTNLLYSYSTYLTVFLFSFLAYVSNAAFEKLYTEKHYGIEKGLSYYVSISGALFTVLIFIVFRIFILKNKKRVFAGNGLPEE
jgi:hypothetical protein